MADTWESRDLPVLKAAVELYEGNGRPVRATAIATKVGLDDETVQRALRALHTEPYFDKGLEGGDQIIVVGRPTSAALRVSGQWPSPQAQLERLIAAFDAAAADESRPEEERGRFRQAALWLAGALSQVAIGALGGASGNLMTGG